MPLGTIFKILKTLRGGDADPSEVNKKWFLKRRYWAAAGLVVAAYLYQWNGIVVDDSMRTMILANIEVIRSSIENMIATATALWGVYLWVRGLLGKDKKLKEFANALAWAPPTVFPPFPKVAVTTAMEEKVANFVAGPEKIEETKVSDG